MKETNNKLMIVSSSLCITVSQAAVRGSTETNANGLEKKRKKEKGVTIFVNERTVLVSILEIRIKRRLLLPGYSLTCSMKTMFAILFQEKSFSISEAFEVGRKGPCSVRNPPNPEHPGPPLVQRNTGSVAGLLEDSTNQ